MTIVETDNLLIVKGRTFPKSGTRAQLEACGAIYLEQPQKTESLNKMERMCFENTTYAIVWERRNGKVEDLFRVHYYTDNIKKPNRN